MKEKEIVETFTVDKIILHFKFNENTSNYLHKKYSDVTDSLSGWENKFKKDGLKFSKP